MGSFNRKHDSEFDGTFLKSLSIDDSSRFETANMYDDSTIDLMDIDDSSDLLDQGTEYHTPDPEPQKEMDSEGILTPLTKLSTFLAYPFQSTPIISEEKPLKDSMAYSGDEYKNDDSNEDECKENKFLSNSFLEKDLNDSQRINSSLSSSILSPTTLGAKLAVGSTKLLMAPPPKNFDTTDENIDGTYNTSSFVSTSNSENSFTDKFSHYKSTPELRSRHSNKSNISSFSESSEPNSFFLARRKGEELTEEYIYNPTNGQYDICNNDNNLHTNALNQSYLYRKQMQNIKDNFYGDIQDSSQSSFSNRTPVQIHHHHYYYGPADNQINNSTFQDMMDYSRTAVESTEQTSDVEQSQITKRQSYNLPQPWESNSTPRDKIPYMLSSYLQLIVNFSAAIYVSFLTYSIIGTVKQDISHKLDQHASRILVEIASCERSYNANGCSPDKIVPHLEMQCAYWLNCMNQNPFGGNHSSVSAETIGILINSLIEPLGLKFFLILLGFIILAFVCNFTFGFIRAKAYYGWNESGVSQSSQLAHSSGET